MVAVPAGYDDLLERPLYGHLATARPDGAVQVSPMWFDWDGELLRFAHTTKRQKYRNVQSNPRVAMSISGPDNPYRYLEVRGDVERIEPDRAASFFLRLKDRYSGDAPPPDAPPPREACPCSAHLPPTGAAMMKFCAQFATSRHSPDRTDTECVRT
jgi:PPOX class probable F420-dependent enzyme